MSSDFQLLRQRELQKETHDIQSVPMTSSANRRVQFQLLLAVLRKEFNSYTPLTGNSCYNTENRNIWLKIWCSPHSTTQWEWGQLFWSKVQFHVKVITGIRANHLVHRKHRKWMNKSILHNMHSYSQAQMIHQRATQKKETYELVQSQ